MSFLNPLFLFGLLAASIPILIHLFTRRRPREVRFPSLEFLTEVNQSEIRRLRLKQWLLLLLRTLAVACLALALARPALRGSASGRSGAASTVVVLFDVSGSMGARDARGASLVDGARRVAEDLLAALGPADELLLVPYDETPRPVTPAPSSAVARLRGALQALAPTARRTDHVRALEAAARALGESHALNRELFWLSDFQRAGFGTAPPAAPAGPWERARVYLVPFAPRTTANAALTDAALAPGSDPVALTVGAASFGAAPGDRAVTVAGAGGEGELGRGFVTLPERGESSALLPLARAPEQGGAARLAEDVLPLDDQRWFAAGRAGTLHVLLREDAGPSPLRLALEAGSPASGIAVEVVDAAGLSARAAGADVIVIDDVERLGPVETQALLDHWRGGGAVLLVLGARADAAFWNATLLRELGAGTLGDPETAAPDAAWRLGRTVAGHPALAGFPARPGEPLSTARFQRVRAFAAGAGARTLLAYDRAHPALLEAPHALVFVGSLAPDASDFPVSGAFLPLFHQMVRVLGRGTAAASLVPGERWSVPASTGSWRIEDVAGTEVPSTVAASAGAARLTSAPLERPGLYRVLQDGRVRATFAVNPDVRESDLAAAGEAALVAAFPRGRAQVLHPGEGLARRVREARFGRELWSAFLIAALALLALETLIARAGMPGGAPPRS